MRPGNWMTHRMRWTVQFSFPPNLTCGICIAAALWLQLLAQLLQPETWSEPFLNSLSQHKGDLDFFFFFFLYFWYSVSIYVSDSNGNSVMILKNVIFKLKKKTKEEKKFCTLLNPPLLRRLRFPSLPIGGSGASLPTSTPETREPLICRGQPQSLFQGQQKAEPGC